MRSIQSKFGNLDNLISEVDKSSSELGINLSEIDDLCNEIDLGVETRKDEVEDWPKERKRKEAADSQDPFVLNILSMDDDFNVRTLSMCNQEVPTNSVKRLIEDSSDYIRMVVASNQSPNVTPDILDRIAELTDEPEVLEAVKNHPNTSPLTKHKIENR